MPTKIAILSLWIYVTLLIVGGLIGFLKAGSKVSLVTSAFFALLLSLCAIGLLAPFFIASILVALLAVVFCIRLAKTSKFMPAGMMLILSLAELGVLLFIR
jgi:uncharacterized membrane protein (UPF0136 family)